MVVRLSSLVVSFLIGSALFIAASLVLAWTGPTQAPPNGNVSAPINVGTTDQVKNAGLAMNALAVFGNAIISGTSRYLNFGTVAGSSGYGIRDNAGSMEFKRSGGSWNAIPIIPTCPEGNTLVSNGTAWECSSTPQSAVTTFLTSGTSWTVPADWNSSNNTIEVIGGGGGGDTPGSAGGGGGGGR